MKTLNEKEYRRHPAINQTLLGKFHTSSPEETLAAINAPPIFKYEFELGHELEYLLYDAVFNTETFKKRYFIADITNEVPPGLIEWIHTGESLLEKYVYTKSGEKSKTCKARHAWLDACIDEPARVPVKKSDFEIMEQAVANILKVDLSEHYGIDGMVLADVLKHGEYQTAILWDDRKALLDFHIVVNDEIPIVIDFKFYASFGAFAKTLRSKGWLQDIHYISAITAHTGKRSPQMCFLVAEKATGFGLVKPFFVDPDSRDHLTERYFDILNNYRQWQSAGYPVFGVMPADYVKIY